MIRFRFMPAILFFVFLAALTFPACKKKDTPAPVTTTKLFSEPVPVSHFEEVSGALSQWRTFRDTRPTLVLFSNDPFLKLVPEEMQGQIREALEDANDAQLLASLDHLRPSPLLLPEMTVTAALLNKLFREIIWVVSAEPSITTRMSDFMTKQLETYGAFGAYTPMFRKKDGVFSGNLYETPIRIVGHDNLIDIEGPVVVHVDLSHFSPLYKDEIRTPLLNVLKEFAADIHKHQWDTLTLTLSSASRDGRMPLPSRAISPILTRMAAEPDILTGAIPPAWEKLSLALYQETFFQMESMATLYREMAELEPGNAYPHYGAYRALKQMRKPDEALDELGKACSLEPAYAVEYQQLARQAMLSDEYLLAIDMLQLARRFQPLNIFIDLQLAETYLHFQKHGPGSELVTKLRNIPWSPTYYAGIAARLVAWQEQFDALPADSGPSH